MYDGRLVASCSSRSRPRTKGTSRPGSATTARCSAFRGQLAKIWALPTGRTDACWLRAAAGAIAALKMASALGIEGELGIVKRTKKHDLQLRGKSHVKKSGCLRRKGAVLRRPKQVIDCRQPRKMKREAESSCRERGRAALYIPQVLGVCCRCSCRDWLNRAGGL